LVDENCKLGDNKITLKGYIMKVEAKSVIYNLSPKTKAELRAESEKAMQLFLKRGGEVEVGRSARARKTRMAGKTSRGFVAGTGGFATGYPRKSTGAE
jgi:hypothetical protein